MRAADARTGVGGRGIGMRAEERHQRLPAWARSEGRVEVASVARERGVAVETVRRDLSGLERRGLVRRTHGGAYPVESAGFETDLAYIGSDGISRESGLTTPDRWWPT